MIKSISNKIFLVLILLSVFLGFCLAITNSYGYDIDTYSMIYTFLNLIHNGTYIHSRLPGSPVAELGIGALAWLGGSKLTNSFNLILFLSSVILYPYIFKKNIKLTNYLSFLALCITSPLLLFENTHAMDYSWGLFFFILGSIIYSRTKYNFVSVLLFVLSIGSRFIYSLYIIPIFLFNVKEKSINTLSKRIIFTILTIFFSVLIFTPIWYFNNLSLDLLKTVSGDERAFMQMFGRFIYKNIMNFGLIQSLIISLLITKNLANKNKILWIKENNLFSILIIIFLNMIVFFKLPYEPMYLQISLISIYYIISTGFEFKNINKIFIAGIISMNIFGWFKTIDIIQITYESNNACSSVNAIQAEPNLSLKKGKLDWLIDKNDDVICFNKLFEDINGFNYSSEILKGESLR